MWRRSVVFALLFTPVPGLAESLSPEWRRDDPRLETPVTVKVERARLGDLLKALSEQSKIPLATGDRDGAADPVVMADLRGVALFDALDSLWSLVSYKGAGWHWVREGSVGEYRYRLTRPLAARNLAPQLRENIQARFEQEAATARAYLRMDRRKLEKHAATDRQARAILTSPTHRAGLQIFFECIPPADQTRILRGEVRHYRVNVADMPGEAQAVITDIWIQANGFRILADGTREPTPAPTFVIFDVGKGIGAEAVPRLGMQVEHLGGGGHLGGRWLQEAFAAELLDRWILPGDQRSHRLEKVAPAEPPDDRRGGQIESVFRKRLAGVTEGASLSLLARLPTLRGGSSWDPAEEPSRTIGEYLDRFNGFPAFLQRKWRGDVLLLTYVAWPQDELKQVPRWLVDRLRTFDVIPIEELVRAAGILSQEQLRTLGSDFPVMNNVATFQNLLSAVHARNLLSQLRSERGIPLTPELAAAVLSDNHSTLARFVQDGTAKALRVTEDLGPSGGTVTFGVILQDGRFRRVQGFRVQPLRRDIPR